jgi:hypothetical protein
MSAELPPVREVRSGFLLGLGCVVALVLGALAFFGRQQAGVPRPGEAARAVAAKTVRTNTGHPVRSSAKLQLDEAGNILPDAPELGPKVLADLNQVKFAELQALAEELGCADKSRLFGFSASAEKALDEMMKEPRWKQLDQEIDALAESWPEANQEERQVILDRTSAFWDQGIIEARRRLAALR